LTLKLEQSVVARWLFHAGELFYSPLNRFSNQRVAADWFSSKLADSLAESVQKSGLDFLHAECGQLMR
jgi:hypothetical protein